MLLTRFCKTTKEPIFLGLIDQSTTAMQETTSQSELSTKVHGDPLLMSSEASQHRTLSPQVAATQPPTLLMEEHTSSDSLFDAHEKSIQDSKVLKQDDAKQKKRKEKEAKKKNKVKEGETGSEKKKKDKKDKKKDKKKEGTGEIKKTKLENVDPITEAIERAAEKAMSELRTVHPSHYVKDVIESDDSPTKQQGLVKFEGHHIEHGTAKEFTSKDIGKAKSAEAAKRDIKLEEQSSLLQPKKQVEQKPKLLVKEAFETPIMMPGISQQDSSLKCSVPFAESKDKVPFEARQAPALMPGLSQAVERKPLIERPLMQSNVDKPVSLQADFQQAKQADSMLAPSRVDEFIQSKQVPQQQPTLVQNMVQPDLPSYTQTIPSYKAASAIPASNRMPYVQPHMAQSIPQSTHTAVQQQNLIQNLVQPDFMPTNSASFVPTTSSSNFVAPSTGEYAKPDIQRKSFVTSSTANANQPYSVDSIYSQTINAQPNK